LLVLIFPLGLHIRPPSDRLGHKVAALLIQPGAARDRLTAGMYLPKVHGKKETRHAPSPLLNPLPHEGEEANESLREFDNYDEMDAVGALEAALVSTLACEPLQAVLEKAHREGQLTSLEELLRISEARDKNIINAEQALQLERDYALRRKVIMVDDFAPDQLKANRT